jgi:uncharacterized protein with FMN-binding domain
MKIFLKIVLSIVIVFVLLIAGGIFFLTRGLSGGSKLAISNVNTSTLSDGVYNGKYNGGRWSNELIVTVENHKITDIKVIKDVLFPKPEATQELINKVLDTQSIDVDVVSGATVTSKAYQKAIENALEK